jgi:tousled-like kinase
MSEIQVRANSNSELLDELVIGMNHRISLLDARLTGSTKKTPEKNLECTPTKATSPDSDLNRSPELSIVKGLRGRPAAASASGDRPSLAKTSGLSPVSQKANSSTYRKKRPRAGNSDSDIEAEGLTSGSMKHLCASPVFSGAGQVQEQSMSYERMNSNSIGARSPTDSNQTDIISELIAVEAGSKFLTSGLMNSLASKLTKVQKDYRQLETVLIEKAHQLSLKESLNHNLQQELKRAQDLLMQEQDRADKAQSAIKRGKLALIRALRAVEEKKRQEIKVKLNNDSYRLGRVTMLRQGTRFQEYWEDGREIREIKEQLAGIQAQKEGLEKQRKTLKKKKEDDELSMTIPLKLGILAREENELRERLDKLEVEKNLHIAESRRIAEEDAARYSKASAEHEPWPVLHSRYLLLSLLGKGGYSEVYKAYDLVEHRELAIKFHQLNPSWAESLKANYIKHALRENQIHRELNFARIVEHYDTLEVDSNCFCTVLEFCPGEDLNTYLKRCKTLSEKEARYIMLQLFAALNYLSSQGEKIIHYDLKPHNIMLNGGEIKITDFGLAKIMDPSKTNMELTSQGVGTYWYLPPECFETGSGIPRISSKVDVWSAGVIFYEILYGQKPFGHNMSQEKLMSDQVISRATSVVFPSKPSVSAECKEFIRRCLEYRQDDRWDVAEAYASQFLQSRK